MKITFAPFTKIKMWKRWVCFKEKKASGAWESLGWDSHWMHKNRNPASRIMDLESRRKERSGRECSRGAKDSCQNYWQWMRRRTEGEERGGGETKGRMTKRFSVNERAIQETWEKLFIDAGGGQLLQQCSESMSGREACQLEQKKADSKAEIGRKHRLTIGELWEKDLVHQLVRLFDQKSGCKDGRKEEGWARECVGTGY